MEKNRIRILRKEHKITQERLAELLNTTQTNISGWERNAWEPSNDSAIKMCDIFDCSLDYLLGRTNVKNNQEVINENKITILGYGLGRKEIELTQEQKQLLTSLVEQFEKSNRK